MNRRHFLRNGLWIAAPMLILARKSIAQSLGQCSLGQSAIASNGLGGATPNNIALVGSNFGGASTSASGASKTFAMPSNVGSNNNVICGVAISGTGLNNFASSQLTKSSGTATLNGSIVLDSSINIGAGNIGVGIYRVPINVGGSLTLQYANGVNCFIDLGAAEFTGFNASPLGNSNSNSGSTSTESSGSITSTVPGMIFFASTEDSTKLWTRSPTDTVVYNQNDGANFFTMLAQFKLISSSPNTLTSATETPAVAWVVATQVYKTS